MVYMYLVSTEDVKGVLYLNVSEALLLFYVTFYSLCTVRASFIMLSDGN